MPCFTMVPPRGDHPVHGHFWVPIDDENNWAWSFDYHPTRALSEYEVQSMREGKGIHSRNEPGSYRPVQNKSNDYLMDRAAQKKGIHYSGIEGIAMQDASLQESMGHIQDRRRENLVSTDRGLIMARQRLVRAATALAENGTPPPGTDPEVQKIRSVAIVLHRDQPFKDAAADALRAEPGKPHSSV
jgi:phthalate 4,5-dioxygenase oxygenase subunit